MKDLETQFLEENAELELLLGDLEAELGRAHTEIQRNAEKLRAAEPKVTARTHRMAQVSYYGSWNGDLQKPKAEISYDEACIKSLSHSNAGITSKSHSEDGF